MRGEGVNFQWKKRKNRKIFVQKEKERMRLKNMYRRSKNISITSITTPQNQSSVLLSDHISQDQHIQLPCFNTVAIGKLHCLFLSSLRYTRRAESISAPEPQSYLLS